MEEQKIKPYDRGRQILKILSVDGPLSVRALNAIIEPKMPRRRLCDALKRLYDNGLTTKRRMNIFGDAAAFYQTSLRGRKLAAKVLNVHPESLLQPHFTEKGWREELD